MERVAFIVDSTGERIGCLLNPEGLVVRRWSGVRRRRSIAGAIRADALADDPLVFTGGGRTELELELLFDVDLAGSNPPVEDVRELTQPLWRLAENVEIADGATHPPVIRFVWGKAWNVPAVVAAVAERLEAFGPAGAPRRSWMRIRLLRVIDPGARPQPLEGTFPAEEEPIEVHQVVGGGALAAAEGAEGPPPLGERLDQLAQRYYGDPAAWRAIAEANDLDDPLHLPPGAALRIPPKEAP
jgi:hypothetical protein